jgi:hypothetical protein
LKGKKLQKTMILEQAEEIIEEKKEPEKEPEKDPDIFEIEIVNRKTKKQREKKIKTNPPGKRGTRKRKPVELIIDETNDV